MDTILKWNPHHSQLKYSYFVHTNRGSRILVDHLLHLNHKKSSNNLSLFRNMIFSMGLRNVNVSHESFWKVINLRCSNFHQFIFDHELPILTQELSPLDDGPGTAPMGVLVAAGVPPGGVVSWGIVLLKLEHVVGYQNPLLLAFPFIIMTNEQRNIQWLANLLAKNEREQYLGELPCSYQSPPRHH